MSGLRLAHDPDAPAACEATADAFARAEAHCGLSDYDASRGEFVQAAANGDCATVIQVRDPKALVTTCFAKLPGADAGVPEGGADGGVDAGAPMTCDDLAAGKLDVSCRSQLIHE